ncbi:MAG: DinB family protein [Planctomycetota bacterium]|nr:DinB family protein [Planctomycetota bacterium]
MSSSGGLSADPLDILIHHNDWATGRVLDFCREIEPAKFHQGVGIGPGSLHDTLTHIIGAMRRWADRIGGRTLRPSIEIPEGSTWSYFDPSKPRKPAVPRRTIDELVAMLDAATRDLLAIAQRGREQGLGSTFAIAFGTKQYTFSIAGALTHVMTHGTHHRAQCLFMLRQFGPPCFADGVPEIGVADWQVEVETKELAPYQPRPFAGRPEVIS